MPRGSTQFIADEIRRLRDEASDEFLRGVRAGQILMREEVAKLLEGLTWRQLAKEVRELPVLDLEEENSG